MGDTVSNQSGGVDISGQANVGGDIVGRDSISLRSRHRPR